MTSDRRPNAMLASASRDPSFALVVQALYSPMIVSLAKATEDPQDFSVGLDWSEHRDCHRFA